MKKSYLYGTFFILFGLIIALGPKFIFKICSIGCICCSDIPQCYWTSQAEIGMGFLISAIGFCFFIFTDPKTNIGLIIGIFLSSIVSLLIPITLIGGCGEITMNCRRIAFPALIIENVILLILSLSIMIVLVREIYFPEIRK